MKKHLAFICGGFAAWGCGMTIIQTGNCVNLYVKVALFVVGMAFYIYVTIAHMPKLQKFIDEHEKKPPLFDFEKEKTEKR